METSTEHLTAIAAVHAWWQAWQDKDRDTLARMAQEDYLEYPGGGQRRNIGRHRILEVADRSFARATIRSWSIDQVEVRQHAEVVLCSYHWSEQGVLDGAEFDLHGFATDVLVQRDGEWRYQSHHVSNLDRDG